MNIAVFHNLPSGGGKRALYEQVRRLSEKHTIDVYTLSSADHDFGDLRPFCREHRVYSYRPGRMYRRPIGRLNQGVRTADLLRLNRLQKAIAYDVDAGGYDVVLVHSCQFMTAPALLAHVLCPSAYYCHEPPRMLYEPTIVRSHNVIGLGQRLVNLVDPLPGLYRRTLGRLDRLSTCSANMVMVNSHYSRETFYRVYGTYAVVATLGVETELFRPMNLAREDYVLSVGALNPRKGYEFLIHSLAQIAGADRPELRIVCNSEELGERAYLQGLAAGLGVSVTIYTMVSDTDLVSLYNRALLTIYAPVMEPFGFVPLESMACGTPVLGVREAGVRESVSDGVTGVLVDRDAKSYATELWSLLDDSDRYSRLAEACRPYVVENWSWDASVARLETLLELTAGRP